MDSEYLLDLKRILGAITVVSPASFSCDGRGIETKPEELISSLADFIYRNCYITRFCAPSTDRTASQDPEGDLTNQLRKAHRGRPCWDSGWRIEQVLDAGYVLARKAGAVRRFRPGSYLILEGAWGPPEEGRPVTICLPKDSTTIQEQFYVAFGETVSESDDGDNLIRFYWNITAEGAAPLVDLLTGTLNRFQTPFQLKCLNHREWYPRQDAAVLYVNKKHYTIAALLVADAHQKISAHLLGETPLFTKRLGHGLALAESPGTSFGSDRCKIVARALWAAYEKGFETGAERLEELDRQFRERGLALERPYLNPGSVDRYELPVPV